MGRKAVIWVSILGVAPFTMLLPYANLQWTGILSFIIGFTLASAFSAIVLLGQELMPGRVGMVSGLFFGFAFGVGGVGAAILGVVADHAGVQTVYRICAFLPLLGLVAAFLPARAPRAGLDVAGAAQERSGTGDAQFGERDQQRLHIDRLAQETAVRQRLMDRAQHRVQVAAQQHGGHPEGVPGARRVQRVYSRRGPGEAKVGNQDIPRLHRLDQRLGLGGACGAASLETLKPEKHLGCRLTEALSSTSRIRPRWTGGAGDGTGGAPAACPGERSSC